MLALPPSLALTAHALLWVGAGSSGTLPPAAALAAAAPIPLLSMWRPCVWLAGWPVLQNNLVHKINSHRAKENGVSMSAATGSKDSLYTVQDPALAALPAAPKHRIAAGQQAVQAYDRYGNPAQQQWC